MYQIIANEIINHKKVKLSVVLNGGWKGKRIVFDGDTGRYFADDGIPEQLADMLQSQAGTGIMRLEPGAGGKDAAGCEDLGENLGLQEPIEIFTETLTAEPELVILGGGHVAVPVCHLAALVGFRVTVVEDRPDLAVKERFPDADRIICQPFDDLSAILDAQGENSFYVIVTRGHQADQICLEQILRREYAYIGVIGSRRKVMACRDRLYQSGFHNADIASVHMPIGLNIGAQTPEEIAVSILGEIIQEKNRKQTNASSLEIWRWITEHAGERGVMAVIIEKSGSAPRGVGSRMLCLSAGSIVGTIGGGVLEYAVIQAAGKLQEDETQVFDFYLNNEKSAELGMVCGGSVRVLMQEVKF